MVHAQAQNNKSPLVSVAIVTYNQLEFLRECVEAVQMQDYPNLQIVVADDGSSDGTVEYLKECSRLEPERFCLVLSPTNRGITANQNAAHFACKGKYIAWTGGDDLMLPGKITSQVEYLESHPDCAICYHDLDVFDSASGRTIALGSDRCKPRQGDLRTVVRFGTFNGACSNMVRRECTPQSGFDGRLPIASDWLYWIDTLRDGGRIGYLDRVLGRHRRHENNITGSGSSREPMLKSYQDHLMTCELVLSSAPWLSKEIAFRRAALLKDLRWLNAGRDYDHFLRASLAAKPSAKVLAALVASRLLKIRR